MRWLVFLCFQRRTFCKLIEWFQIFYWTHLLYIPFWIALIIHGPNFWKWFLGPGTLFIIEKIVRFHLRWAAHGKTYISSATVFPSRVTHLVIKKPPNFRYYLFSWMGLRYYSQSHLTLRVWKRYQPGDYVFIKIKSISRAEWHPFTISSAPELPGKQYSCFISCRPILFYKCDLLIIWTIKTIYGFTFEALAIGQTSYSIILINNKRQFVWKNQLLKVNLRVYAVLRYFGIQIRPLVASAGIRP